MAQAIYDRLLKEGRIGPNERLDDGQGGFTMRQRPYAEYPKHVKNAAGVTVTVQNQREELAVLATAPEGAPADPVVEEKNRLLSENYRLEQELRDLRARVDSEDGRGNEIIEPEPKPSGIGVGTNVNVKASVPPVVKVPASTAALSALGQDKK